MRMYPNTAYGLNFIYLELENVAYLKPTSQSSTGNEGDSSRAVDGNGDGEWTHHTCTHTASNDNEPWWRVDLEQVYRVHKVRFAVKSNT